MAEGEGKGAEEEEEEYVLEVFEEAMEFNVGSCEFSLCGRRVTKEF